MGVERAVTRWYVQRQLLLDEVAQLEAKIASSSSDDEATDLPSQPLEWLEEIQKLEYAKKRLRTLGECPRPMMG